MKSRWKQAVSVLLTAAMLAGMLIVPAAAEETSGAATEADSAAVSLEDPAQLSDTGDTVAAGVYYFSKYNHQGQSTSDYHTKLTEVAGIEFSEGFSADSTGHGPQGSQGTITVSIPEGKYSTLVVTTCGFGADDPLKTTSSGEMTSKALTDCNSKGREYTITNATGTTVLTFEGTVYLHGLTVGEITDEAVTPPPSMSLDATSVVVRVGEANPTVTPTVANGTVTEITATPANPSIVTAAVSGGVITLTPVAKGTTTVTVSVTVSEQSEPLTADVAVRVLPEDIGTVTESTTYTFNVAPDPQAEAFYAEGLEWTTTMTLGNNHGPYATRSVGLNVYLPEGKQADLTIITCGYGSGTGATMTANSDEVSGTEVNVGDGDSNLGKQFVVTGATGTVTLAFSGSSQIYIHSLEVGAFSDAPNITVETLKEWDFSGLTGYEQWNTIASDAFGADGPALTNVLYHGTAYGSAMGETSSIAIPVDGPCNIKVNVGYSWALQMDDDAFTQTGSGSQTNVIFYYTGEAGTVTLTSISGTSYVKSITLTTATTPTADLRVDSENVTLKLDGTTATTVQAHARSTGAVTAASSDETIATASADASGLITIKAVAAGDATVTVSAGSLTKTIKVTVEPEGEVVYYIAAGSYDFNGKNDLTDAAYRGMTVEGLNGTANTHGLEGRCVAKITLNLERKASVTFTTCRYGAGTGLVLTTTSGAVSKSEPVDESGADGLQIVVTNAGPGEVTFTFTAPTDSPEHADYDPTSTMGDLDGSGIWIPFMRVDYASLAREAQVDVWDIGGKVENQEHYVNYITPAAWAATGELASGTLSGGTSVTFGDLTLAHNTNDRIYSNVESDDWGDILGSNNGTTYVYEYADGYTSAGGIYCNGAGSATTRNLTIANCFPGDKFIAYMGSCQNADVPFVFEGIGSAADQEPVTVTAETGTYDKYVFVADYEGTYRIRPNGGGKAMYHRLIRIPGVTVTGTITFPADYNGGDGYTLRFVNTETKAVTDATVGADGSYSVTLAAGYTYNARLSGVPGWGVTLATKELTLGELDGVTYAEEGVTKNVSVEAKKTYKFSGSFTGFAADYDLSNLAVALLPDEISGSEEMDLEIDKTAKTFEVYLDPGTTYTLQMLGVNDYQIVTPETVSSEEADVTADIEVELKPTHTASGKFIDLEGNASEANVTAISFKILDEDGDYTYAATVSDGGYTAQLRDGAYEAVVTVSGYSVIHHVVVSGGDVEKDMLLVSTATKPAVDWAADVYVGYPGKANNYDTVTDAVDAISRMGVTSEEQRVTVHIAPGTYREQILVSTPYVSFVNDEPDQEVLLTWYYGIGYVYYSSGNTSGNYYNAQRAYDKYEKKIADRWGTAVRVTGKGFRAENITFENSFNRYVTDEEIADGVEPSGGEAINLARNYALDVQSKAATERAAAMCVEADECEFYNCKFYSSQDTLYTQAKVYFKNCFIEGQTDYIYGDTASKCIFDGCVLSWKGYSAGSTGGYITALRTDEGDVGYLFRNCSVVANSKLTVSSGYFGRPWSAKANVKFVNTKLENADLITSVGWYSMNGAPEDAQFGEYGTTTMAGDAVDTSGRAANCTMTQAEADALTRATYYGAWVPYYYVEEETTVAFTTDPYISDNGDINTPYPGHTLTVKYSLGTANDANDASTIQWYRVAADGTETLLKSSTATVDATYQLTTGDVGSRVKVKVIPATVSGNTGEAKTAALEYAVLDGYEDPTGKTDPELGDGVNIFLAGDSTVCDYTGRDEGSWGEWLQNYLDEDLVTVVNEAVGGRSSRSFINEGRLDTIAANIKAGDYLFIQFGHNDCSNEDSYREERYAPLGDPDASGSYPYTAPIGETQGNYTWNGGGTYKWYLQQYVDVALNAGAIPVLVTPVSRMYYESDGTIRPHHDPSLVPGTEETTKTTNNDKSNTYCDAVKQVYEENLAKGSNVLFIDGFEMTKALFEDAYAAAGNNTYGLQIMSSDSTHCNKLGGMIEAALMAQAIQKLDVNISKVVQGPSKIQGSTTKDVPVFVVDGAGNFTAYNKLKDYAEETPYWEGVGQALFDAIAAKAAELNADEGPVEPGGTTTEPADVTALTAAIAEAEALADDYTVRADGTEASSVTKGSEYVLQSDKDALDAAIAAAQAVADKDGVTQTEADAAVKTLNAAMDAFNAAVKTGTKTTTSSSNRTSTTKSDTVTTTTATKTNDDGSKVKTVTSSDGAVAVTVTDANGEVLAEVNLPATVPSVGYKFADVPDDHWAAKAINAMAGLGMVKGVDDVNHVYDMTSATTRGAVATILYRLSNGKSGLGNAFSDVADGDWYADGVAWAAKTGVVNGYSAETFAPDDPVTREQLASMLYRYAGLLALDTAKTGDVTSFTDAAEIDGWASEAMAWAVGVGLLQGDETRSLNPTANATRAETAVMLQRFLELVK